jgi:hypothetical protein
MPVCQHAVLNVKVCHKSQGTTKEQHFTETKQMDNKERQVI